MRFSWMIPLVLLCVETVQSQGQVSEVEAPRHIVSGTVVDSVTGVPIPRALVKLEAQPGRYVLTDANGTFRFEGVAEGLLHMEAEKPGFFSSGEAFSDASSASSFQISGDMNGVVLKLIPEARLSGHVRSIQGFPIEGFQIRVYRKNIVDGAVQWEDVVNVNTDHEGYFRIYSMPKESVIVSAGPEKWRLRPTGAKQVGYPLVFYPNAREFSAASVLLVSPGEQIETDFSLDRQSLCELSGTVVGVPAAFDTKVELITQAGEPVPLGQPHPQQHEFFGYVTPGTYILRASAEINGKNLRATLPLTITGNTTGIQVSLASQLAIPVTLRTESDGNNNGTIEPFTANVELISTTSSFAPVRLSAEQMRDRDESVMEVAGAEPGTYRVEITPNDSYVKAATSGSTDLLQNDLVVPEAGRVSPIEVVLRNDGGEVGGKVKLPDRKGAATVLLVPASGSSRNIRTVAATREGNFLFEQVRPGTYLVLAFNRVDDLEYRNPDALSKYVTNATQVVVSARQRVTASLDLIELGN